jgi:anion-transporting  ArsA/GET3 family ATPase
VSPPPPVPASLAASLAARRVLVCVGAGGVGKTSVAAALGLARAMEGGRVLVCTIDPARRLASAMGLGALGNLEARVPDHAFSEAGLAPRGELFAMMLDVKRTWDDLVTRHAPDPARRDRILRNRLYQQMSSALAGSQEYMAMEKLHELATSRDYDLIVLDTPPTAHALDFLDAPDRILDFLGNDAARTMLAPALGAGRLGLRLAQLGSTYVAKTVARFTGTALLADLGDFMAAFHGMYDGFQERAGAVRRLLAQPTTGFVLVASPGALAIDEALALHERLHAEAMPVAGLVANRVTPDLCGPGPVPDAAALLAALPGEPSLAGRLAVALADHQRAAAADAAALRRLFDAVAAPGAVVPRLSHDVHDLAGLAELGRWLATVPEPTGVA